MVEEVSDKGLDQDRLDDFMHRVALDSGAAAAGVATSLGARLGLYAAMAGAGPITSVHLAERTGLVERYVREWLAAQVAGQYIEYDPDADTYLMPDEHAAVLADPAAPTYQLGGAGILRGIYGAEDALADAFRTGAGINWADYGSGFQEGVAQFFRPHYVRDLPEWLSALDGVTAKLERGASVADVGCGYGFSTLLMAAAYPSSQFRGFDFHEPSIDAARREAAAQGLAGRVSFDVAGASDFAGAGAGYDLITFFDCLHDLGDPGAALTRAAKGLAADGTCMIVEPNTSGHPLENINPVGRSFTATSVAICLPVALAQRGPVALGNHPGEGALRAIAADAGLRSWRLAAETIGNRVYEARCAPPEAGLLGSDQAGPNAPGRRGGA
jgi:2-polyprenyl-3-methyl-5-hydroxy-6-metoxy-1,4-benzoquinol methylase